jgi:hypothetical protein
MQYRPPCVPLRVYKLGVGHKQESRLEVPILRGGCRDRKQSKWAGVV